MLFVLLDGRVASIVNEIVQLIKLLLDGFFLTLVPLHQVLQVFLLVLQLEDLRTHISHLSIVLRL